jgi:phosphatidylserine decarboxylase
MTPKTIQVFDRRTGSLFTEKVFGDFAMRCAYGNKTGMWFVSRLLVRQSISQLMGTYYDSALSKPQINSFMNDYKISSEECEKTPDSFSSFNDFFARKLKPHARPICAAAPEVASPGDGRLLVFPKISMGAITYAKWAPIQIRDLFDGDENLAHRFDGGACAILRLCPTDYHRFHFPVSGTPSRTRTIEGVLHSVNPYALENRIPVYCLNKRTICQIQSEDLGEVCYMEIGALGVGSIVQTYAPDTPLLKGAEKGFFKFGGSTVILFFEPGSIKFDDILVQNSSRGIETLVRMGERIAIRSPE